MYNKIVAKGLVLLLLLPFFLISILIADMSWPQAPVEIEITVSKDKIFVDDSIDVYATISLLKDHPNYSEGNEYHVLQLSNYSKLPSGKLLRNKYQLWEALYSDTTKTVNDENPVVDFFCRIKLAKLPSHKEVDISDITVAEIMEGYLGYEKVNLTKSKKIGKLTIECLNEGLKERSKPLNRCPGNFPVIVKSKELPKIEPIMIDLDTSERAIPVKTEYLIREINIDKSHLVEGKNYYVHVNTTTAFKFSSPISDVTCDSFIGSVSTSNQYEITYKSTDAVGSKGYIYLKMDGQNWQMHIELIGNSDIHKNRK